MVRVLLLETLCVFCAMMDNNPSSIYDVPVGSLVNSKVDKEHDAIIISVTPRKPDIQQEIFKLLDDTGYKNIIVLTKELQEALGV